MRALLSFAMVVFLASPATSDAQLPNKQPGKAPVTTAVYMVTGLHCAPCAQTVESSLKKVNGVQAVAVNFQGKYAKITFDENALSAQAIARAMSGTAHMMGNDMHYGGILVLSVPGVNQEVTATKVTAALNQVKGVAKVLLYPRQQAVGIQFTGKGNVTSKQLLDALAAAGLEGAQYVGSRTASEPATRAMNAGTGSMPGHTGMAMGKGGMAGPGGMGGGMAGTCPACGPMAAAGMGIPNYAPASWANYGSGGWTGGCGCHR